MDNKNFPGVRRMRKSLLFIVFAVVLGACSGGTNDFDVPDRCEASPTCNQPPPPPPSAVEQFTAAIQGLTLDGFYSTAASTLAQRSPETLIWSSLLDTFPQAEAQLDSLSDAYQRETFELYQIALDALRSYDRSILDADGQFQYDLFEWYLQDVVDRLPFIYNDFPATFGVFGVPRGTEQLFTEVHPFDNVQDAQDYIARLGQVERKFNELVEHLDLQAQNGIIEPAITLQVAINQVAAIATMPTEQIPYYAAFLEKVTDHPAISATQETSLANQAFNQVNGGVRRAYQDLLAKLQELLPSAPAQIGVGQFPNGSAYYDYTLRHHTTTDLTAAQIHQLGLDELARIQAEMQDIFVNQLGYDPNLTLPEYFALVTQDGGVIPAANVQATYEGIIDQAKLDLDPAFDIFPTADVVVIGDPNGGGYYIAPAADGSRPGAFYAATSVDQPWFQMRSLAYHEAIPGHHTQIAIAMDQNFPVARKLVRSTGFIEGWALYAERLAWEQGWHAGDPYSNLGRLQYEALRAARLVIDTGIHSLGWTWDEAVQFNQDNLGATLGASQGAVARYSVWPGQATAYMVGMLQILSERQRATDLLGAQFDLKAFHRALLTNGSVPLALLDEVVDRYIAEAQAGN
jgi:uncharacterized protein (DUF885 family)